MRCYTRKKSTTVPAGMVNLFFDSVEFGLQVNILVVTFETFFKIKYASKDSIVQLLQTNEGTIITRCRSDLIPRA